MEIHVIYKKALSSPDGQGDLRDALGAMDYESDAFRRLVRLCMQSSLSPQAFNLLKANQRVGLLQELTLTRQEREGQSHENIARLLQERFGRILGPLLSRLDSFAGWSLFCTREQTRLATLDLNTQTLRGTLQRDPADTSTPVPPHELAALRAAVLERSEKVIP